MDKFINKIWKKSGKEAFDFVYESFEKNGYAVINYIYGGNITNRNIFEKDKKLNSTQKKIKTDYNNALLQSTVLLPDGIALQLFVFVYFLFVKKKFIRLNNLNGTDYLKFFFSQIKKKDKKIKLILYGAHPNVIKKSVDFFEKKWGFDVFYFQDGYKEFDRKKFDKKEKSSDDVFVLIQGRTEPDNPLQELRTLKNIEKIKKNNFIVINSGGLFDSKDRGGHETRAPKFVRFIKCERLRKAILYPEKGGLAKIMSNFKLISIIFNKIILKK